MGWFAYAGWFARSEILRVAQNDKDKIGVGFGRFAREDRAGTRVPPL